MARRRTSTKERNNPEETDGGAGFHEDDNMAGCDGWPDGVDDIPDGVDDIEDDDESELDPYGLAREDDECPDDIIGDLDDEDDREDWPDDDSEEAVQHDDDGDLEGVTNKPTPATAPRKEPPKRDFAKPERERYGLVCPRCGCGKFHVIYTRRAYPHTIRRRRECRHCGRRITTAETVLG